MGILSSTQTRERLPMPARTASAGFLAGLAGRVIAAPAGWRLIAAGLAAALAVAVPAESAAQSAARGGTIWAGTDAANNANCADCHGSTPVKINTAPRNAANAGNVITHANANSMGGLGTLNTVTLVRAALTAQQVADLAAYIATFTSNPNPSNVPVGFSGTTSDITIPQIYLNSTYGAFTSLVFDSASNGGSATFTIPAGPGANGTANYTAGTCRTGTDAVTYHATGPAGSSNRRTFTVRIANPPVPSVNSSASPGATVGTAFRYDITVASCSSLVTGYAAAGLPDWLSLNTTNGRITGTPPPTAADTVVRFSVTATNAGGTSAKHQVALTVNFGAPTIDSAATATSGAVGIAYAGYTVTATNSPTSFTVAAGAAPNILPPGLTLNPSTGQVTGTPTTAGTFTPTLQATNSIPLTGSKVISFVIYGGAPVINSPATASGRPGVAFSYQITATNNPTSFNATGLPPGLTVDTTTGLISGTPTAGGTFNVALSATNDVPLTGTQRLAISVGDLVPVVTSPAVAQGVVGIAFAYQIAATTNPTSFNATGLPPGLAVNTATGLISGTPTANGVYNATVSATNATPATGSQAVTITINVGAPVVTSAATASGATGQSFSYQIAASNNPTSFNATGLPNELSVNASTGLISGTPVTPGTFTVTVSATNGTGTGTRPVTFSLSLSAPGVTSPATASGTTGVPFSYQITSTSSPTSFGATGLPPGLSVDTSTGLISGTPAAGGTFKAVVSATNPAGTATLEVTITIAFVAPIAGDLDIEVQFGAATPIKLPLSGQFTQVAIVTAPSHGTAATPAPGSATVVYTPTGSYSGSDSFTYNAAGPGGTSQTAQVNITVPSRAPLAQAVALTVPLNTPTTVDLLPFISGSGLTGVAISVDAAHGSTEVNGTKVTYSPKQNYFGSDSFTYYAFGNVGTSPPAVVTVTVTGRPDPSKDPNVVGLLGGQSQVARRFARAQISNFQRRMETLHVDPPNSDAAAAPAAGGGVGPAAGPVAGEAGRMPAASQDTGQRPGSGMDDVARQAPPGANGFVRTGGEPATLGPRAAPANAPGMLPASFVNSIVSMAQSGTVNLANSADRGDASAGVAQGLGVWIGGNVSFGTQDSTEHSSGWHFSTDGITVGGDWRVSDRLVLGMGAGYAQDKTHFGDDRTQMKSDGSSIAAYASYRPTRGTFIDALLGYGTLNFDTDRYVPAVDEFANGRRKGSQVFGSVAGGFEYRNDSALLSPYGRLDFTFDRFKQASETGAGLNALTYQDQTQRTVQLSLGLRAESQHATDFGMVRPRMRAEYRHDFEGGGNASVTYADGYGGLTYSVTPVGTDRNFLLLGVGSDFIFHGGLRLGFDYQWQSSGGADSGQALRFLLAQELDGKGWTSSPWSSRPFADPVRVEAGYTFDDNVTRGRVADEILSDKIYSLNLATDRTFPIDDNTRVVVTGLLNGEMFHTYTGLGHLSGGLQAELQYRGSADFDAVTFTTFARGWLDGYGSRLRDGGRYSIGVGARRSLTDRIDVYGELSGNVRRAQSAVWDLVDYCARLNLDYSLGRSGAFYLTGEFHRGDSVSDGNASLVNLSLAEVFVLDDAFPGDRLFAYRFDAKTWVGTLGYNLPLGPRDSIDVSWRRVQSTPTARPAFDSPGSLRYVDNQYSIVYLLRF